MLLQDEFREARKALVEDIKAELVDPEKKEGLVIDSPAKRFSVGMLFPEGYENRNKEANDEAEENQDEMAIEAPSIETSSTDLEPGLANSFFPSVMGLSFYVLSEDPSIKLKWACGTYKKVPWEEIYAPLEGLPSEAESIPEFKENFTYHDKKLFASRKLEGDPVDTRIKKAIADIAGEGVADLVGTAMKQVLLGHLNGAWKLIPQAGEIRIDSISGGRKELFKGVELIVNRKPRAGGASLITACLKNSFNGSKDGLDDERIIFHASLRAEAANPVFAEYGSMEGISPDKDERVLAFLYRNKKTFAVGHGCAAAWDSQDPNGKTKAVFTESIPVFELPAADFHIPEFTGEGAKMLSMKVLSGLETGNQVIPILINFVSVYRTWVEGLERRTDIPLNFQAEAANNTMLCKEVLSRMEAGIALVKEDPLALEAFKLANQAMLIQSLHSEMQAKKRAPGTDVLVWPDYFGEKASERAWRPFQLAFLLLSLRGISDPQSADRSLVDLIWFPTGGGKTEAYLGLTAYTIFYRRLRHGIAGGGTTVMMRYTLRLLTAQQFQRACTLICAMEKIRRESHGRLGEEEISVGLWVGGTSTPNTFKEAEFRIRDFHKNGKLPSPLLACPWCGTRLVLQSPRREYAWRRKNRPPKMEFFCREGACEFNKRLPIKVVDEEIYESPTTLLFGTVDKFAQMPNKKGVATIFGLDGGVLPPELIIQDELHLISGALGTMVALYETAVDFLCSRKGNAPKIVASTATIRRAQEQCRSLFNRDARQFPAPGLEIENSFFSKEAPPSTPGRLYVGIMGAGKTQTTVAVRLAAALLRSVQELKFGDEIKDQYWTLVGYFNSIRELGGFVSLIYDDVSQYVNTLKERYGGRLREIKVMEELTSRKDAENIPRILEKLSVKYPGQESIDVLAATNMISVGVDIERLGLMVVRGQPKLTSEYIQVTSRVGRKYPGLVVVLYNSARTRDRAHYERFVTYHESFYRNVEPSSITPFSIPARSRALRAVIVTMIRHTLAGLAGEKDVLAFKNNLPGIDEIEKFLLDRVRGVDPAEEAGTLEEFKAVVRDWQIFCDTNSTNGVYSNSQMGRPLIAAPGENGYWEAPTSMRNVDAECAIFIDDE